MADAFGLADYFKGAVSAASDISAGTVALAQSYKSVKDVINDPQAKAAADQSRTELEKARIAANMSNTIRNATDTGNNPIAVYLSRSGPGNVPVWLYAVGGLGLLWVLMKK